MSPLNREHHYQLNSCCKSHSPATTTAAVRAVLSAGTIKQQKRPSILFAIASATSPSSPVEHASLFAW
ncbi:hypothetical protein RYX36_028629 [Vicia faba]